MKKELNHAWMAEGKALLNDASIEINRAEEDVVNYLVCHHTRIAISNFLKSFLAQNNVSFSDEPVSSLLEKCINIDDRFSNIDLSGLTCSKATVQQNDCYCLNTQRLRACVQTARQIERMLSADVPPY